MIACLHFSDAAVLWRRGDAGRVRRPGRREQVGRAALEVTMYGSLESRKAIFNAS